MSGGDLLPGGYHYFFSSAPTSPSRASSYTLDDHGGGDAATFDFAFGFSGQLQESRPILAAADELFEGGRIRPLNGPHQSVSHRDFDGDYPSASLSPRSPRRTRTTPAARGGAGESESAGDQTRGRSGRPALTSSSSSVSSRSRRATRSLSPYRGESMSIDDEFPSSPPSPRGAASLMRGCGSGSRKWRLKDLFLFRSASEGRASGGKDPLLKYSMLKSGSGGEGNASMRIKGRGSAASASDMAPYTVSRAAAEEMRRRTTTPLPFHRNSLFGYLRSNPAIRTISGKLSSYSSSNRGRNASSTASGYAHA
jgi:hypothetical protein